ncbi:2-phospho-L-lactate guanylyltransferase [Agromyces italicus]|uniref:2-phospho-L-lactate guanylyltransferase n=1 Tax=Agromyces italicus TaxID=279572 RepID=UPI0003B6BB32|nr:2-phospho-L-lactate guanylyltransferase [Agromyces italicus]
MSEIDRDAAAESSPPAVPAAESARWVVVIPVKAFAAAKSRLGPAVPAAARAALARAFALDTITAARAARNVSRIVVVTGEIDLGSPMADGVELVREPAAGEPGVDAGEPTGGGSAAGGLTAAIDAGIDHARTRALAPVAVLLGDLPSLRTSELEFALEAASRHPLAFIADADGTGTTLATAAEGVPMRPAFGEQSAARHREAGFADLAGGAPYASLRRDVDTVEALERAQRLGVGFRTAEAVAALAEGSLPHAGFRQAQPVSTGSTTDRSTR